MRTCQSAKLWSMTLDATEKYTAHGRGGVISTTAINNRTYVSLTTTLDRVIISTNVVILCASLALAYIHLIIGIPNINIYQEEEEEEATSLIIHNPMVVGQVSLL